MAGKPGFAMRRAFVISISYLIAVCCSGCLSYSHHKYSCRAAAARALPEGEGARPGRIYFASFPENNLALDIWGWHPNVGHASLVTRDRAGLIKQYDYGWFVGYDGGRPCDAIGYVNESPSFGVVTRKSFAVGQSAKATNDMEVAKMVLNGMPGYGNKSRFGQRMLTTSALLSAIWSSWQRTRIAGRWRGDAGRLVATAVAM